jgi:peptidoglycan hydrolase CwlO-like protein
MAQIKNINTTPIVAPDKTFIIALKDGHISRIDSASLINNTAIEESKKYTDITINNTIDANNKKIDTLEKKVNDLEKKINELKTALEKVVSEMSSSTESNESVEDDTKKAVRRTVKKVTE